jgi:hypothetical protein
MPVVINSLRARIECGKGHYYDGGTGDDVLYLPYTYKKVPGFFLIDKDTELRVFGSDATNEYLYKGTAFVRRWSIHILTIQFQLGSPSCSMGSTKKPRLASGRRLCA